MQYLTIANMYAKPYEGHKEAALVVRGRASPLSPLGQPD
jgi:hypothetical protein